MGGTLISKTMKILSFQMNNYHLFIKKNSSHLKKLYKDLNGAIYSIIQVLDEAWVQIPHNIPLFDHYPIHNTQAKLFFLVGTLQSKKIKANVARMAPPT